MEEEKVGTRKMYRSATIDVVANGFIITIGCRKLVAGNPETLKQLICNYINDPVGTERDILNADISRNRFMEVGEAKQVNQTEDVVKSDRGHSLKVKSYE